MATNFEKTIYMPHETARATASINNTECKLDCTRVGFAVEMHSSMQIHHDHFSHVYKHAESHKDGPRAGQAEWAHEFLLDLSSIKYEAEMTKEKAGAIKTVSPDDQFIMS